jgi:hypothetical protein
MTKYQVIAIQFDGSETILQEHERQSTADLAVATFMKLQSLSFMMPINYPPLTFRIAEIEND